MSEQRQPIDLLEHLSSHCGVDHRTASRVIDEVMSYYSEPVQGFIKRRHVELQRAGMSNSEIFGSLQRELSERVFRAEPLSERQIRRIIYG